MADLAQIAADKKNAAEAIRVAAEAQKKADALAAADPAVAASKLAQEKAEAEADALARQEAAKELANSNQANAALLGGQAAVVAMAQQLLADPPAPQQLVQTRSVPEIPKRNYRTFQHLYANANTFMKSGKKLTFGGQNGHTGFYTTDRPEEIEHLAELADTPGSMVTETLQDLDGRYLVREDSILLAEQQAVLIASRTNSAAELNPNVATARNNLAMSIAQNS